MNPRAILAAGLVLGLVGPVATRATAHDDRVAAARAGVTAALAGFEAAVTSRRLDDVLEFAAPGSRVRQELRTRFATLLQLDSLRCAERLGTVALHGDTAEAVVREEIAWQEHGRPQVDATWRTRRFVQRAGAYRLTGDEARTFAQARFTDLALALHPEEGSLTGVAHLTVDLVAAGEDDLLLVLNRGLTIDRIEDPAGNPLAFARRALTVAVPLPARRGTAPAGAPDSMTLVIHYHGSLFNESAEQGYSQVGLAPGAAFASWVTQWYPRVAGDGSRSRGRITFDVPESMTVACSGRSVRTTSAGGRSTQEFRVDAPLDYSFAAAPYFHESRTVDGTELGVYLLSGGQAKGDLYIDRCAKILSFLRGLYGSYPFDSYSVVELPADAVGLLGGSSEQGMNLFPTGALPADDFPLALLSHEMGHSWWGNLVKSDGSAMLDEGLAQITAALAVEHLAGADVMRHFLRRGLPGYGQSARDYFVRFAGRPSMDLPLNAIATGGDQGSILHDLADDKGFFVYQMLRETVGDEAFARGLRRAIATRAGSTLHLRDLERMWERESGRKLGTFFEQWLGRSGAPEFRLRYRVRRAPGRQTVVTGTVSQVGDLYAVTADLVVVRKGAPPRTERLAITRRETPFRLALAAPPDTVLFDPAYRILRWTPDDRNIALLRSALELHGKGEEDSARVALVEFLARAPESTAGHSYAGLWNLETGDLEGAEREFRWTADRAPVCDPDDPAWTRSLLGLGKLCDLRGRREEALAWYRQAQARPDDQGMRAEATALLATPYRIKPKADPALLARCVGTFGADPGPTVAVAMGKGGVLSATSSDGRSFGLEWTEGTRFVVVGNGSVKFEFTGGDDRFSQLVVDLAGHVFHLVRKPG